MKAAEQGLPDAENMVGSYLADSVTRVSLNPEAATSRGTEQSEIIPDANGFARDSEHQQPDTEPYQDDHKDLPKGASSKEE